MTLLARLRRPATTPATTPAPAAQPTPTSTLEVDTARAEWHAKTDSLAGDLDRLAAGLAAHAATVAGMNRRLAAHLADAA